MAEYSQKCHNGTSRTRSTKTSNGLAAIQAKLNNLGREIKKVNEKVYAAQVGCEQCKGPHYIKDFPLKEEGKTLKEAYYTQFGAPFQGGGYRAITLGFYQRNNMIPSYQKQRNQGASIKTLEIQIGKMSKVLQEKGFGSLPSSTETNPRDYVKSISTIVEADTSSICRIGSYQYAVSIGQNCTLMYEMKQMTIPFLSRLNDCYCEEKKGSYRPQFLEAYAYGASHIDKSIPQKEKDPRSFTLPCYINNVCFNNALVDLGASEMAQKEPQGQHHSEKPTHHVTTAHLQAMIDKTDKNIVTNTQEYSCVINRLGALQIYSSDAMSCLCLWRQNHNHTGSFDKMATGCWIRKLALLLNVKLENKMKLETTPRSPTNSQEEELAELTHWECKRKEYVGLNAV
ncbi:hypothetical protein Tco_0340287 [Tanacetum coccineum]